MWLKTHLNIWHLKIPENVGGVRLKIDIYTSGKNQKMRSVTQIVT